MSKQREVKLTVRVPSDVMEVIRLLAKQNDRSVNGEIVRALREYAERSIPRKDLSND